MTTQRVDVLSPGNRKDCPLGVSVIFFVNSAPSAAAGSRVPNKKIIPSLPPHLFHLSFLPPSLCCVPTLTSFLPTAHAIAPTFLSFFGGAIWSASAPGGPHAAASLAGAKDFPQGVQVFP